MRGRLARVVQHWDAATSKIRATFWAPAKAGGHNAGIYFTALSADGTTVAWGGEEFRNKDKVRITPQAPRETIHGFLSGNPDSRSPV